MQPMRIAGTVKDGELWIRCPYCGDSQHNPRKAHFGIDLKTGFYYCHRCGAKGKLDATNLLRFRLADYPELESLYEPLPEIIRGPGSPRKSLLGRYHTAGGDDVFASYWPATGQALHVGYYIRGEKKRMEGLSGINWVGAPEQPLLSSPSRPLRIVEGPYDVLTPNAVAFFGMFSFGKMEQFFRGHYFILVPDGDVWTDVTRRDIFRRSVQKILRAKMNLMGIEFLPGAKDPDEAESVFIPIDKVKETLCAKPSTSSTGRRDPGSQP